MPYLDLSYDRTSDAHLYYECAGSVLEPYLAAGQEPPIHGADLLEGQSPDDYAPIAAASLCEVVNESLGLEGEAAYVPRESYLPTQEELDIARYARRGAAHDRLRNEFGAYNLGRVRSGEISPQDMAAWLRSAECEEVLAHLRLLMFEAAIATIPTMIGVGATEDFKQTWAAKLQAEL